MPTCGPRPGRTAVRSLSLEACVRVLCALETAVWQVSFAGVRPAFLLSDDAMKSGVDAPFHGPDVVLLALSWLLCADKVDLPNYCAQTGSHGPHNVFNIKEYTVAGYTMYQNKVGPRACVACCVRAVPWRERLGVGAPTRSS